MVHRQGIPGLDLPHGTRDEHLEHLQGFEGLRTLRLGGTQVTEETEGDLVRRRAREKLDE